MIAPSTIVSIAENAFSKYLAKVGPGGAIPSDDAFSGAVQTAIIEAQDAELKAAVAAVEASRGPVQVIDKPIVRRVLWKQ